MNVEKEASGAGLSGRMMDVSDGVMMHIDDGGRATRVSLRSSCLALAIIGHSISSILSVRRSPINPSARSFWKRASFSNFCAVC